MPNLSITTTQEPLFLHDCPKCVFVGHYADSSGRIGDGYVCHHRSFPGYEGSVIWRLSDEDWENASCSFESARRRLAAAMRGEPGEEGSVFTEILADWEGHRA
jgi:hypothetical protein